jgi:hypothetical protein
LPIDAFFNMCFLRVDCIQNKCSRLSQFLNLLLNNAEKAPFQHFACKFTVGVFDTNCNLLPVSLKPVAIMPPISTTPAVPVGKFTAGVVNTGDKFSTGLVDTGCKFVVDTGGKFAVGVIDTAVVHLD